jgi:hypothetical protein
VGKLEQQAESSAHGPMSTAALHRVPPLLAHALMIALAV